MPKPPVEVQLLKGANEPQDLHTPRLTVRQRYGKLFDELDLSGLDSWAPELAYAAHQLLAKYHDMFSLDPVELGCTQSTEHMIKIMDDTHLRNDLDRFPCQHWLRSFGTTCGKCLESGAIRPSQSAWCNAVVLLQKKDGSLWFSIDFAA